LERLQPTSRRRWVPLVILAASACAGALAKAPPETEPALTRIVVVAGVPISVAAKSARALQDAGFVTKRFSSDSTWASRKVDNMNARLRYTLPTRDSTRVLVELWGTCEQGGRGCLVGELVRLVAALTTEEAPPTD
jgi:hypothetical protein